MYCPPRRGPEFDPDKPDIVSRLGCWPYFLILGGVLVYTLNTDRHVMTFLAWSYIGCMAYIMITMIGAGTR